MSVDDDKSEAEEFKVDVNETINIQEDNVMSKKINIKGQVEKILVMKFLSQSHIYYQHNLRRHHHHHQHNLRRHHHHHHRHNQE